MKKFWSIAQKTEPKRKGIIRSIGILLTLNMLLLTPAAQVLAIHPSSSSSAENDQVEQSSLTKKASNDIYEVGKNSENINSLDQEGTEESVGQEVALKGDSEEVDNSPEPDDESAPGESETEEVTTLPELYLAAVNPGYTVDGVSDVGELIEIKSSLEAPVDLAGVQLSYSNSSGKTVILTAFPENSWMTGDNLVLRPQKSTDPANLTYSQSIALKAGPLVLEKNGEILDALCWDGSADCYPAFKSKSGVTLVRDPLTDLFETSEAYVPAFSPSNYEEKAPEKSAGTSESPHCQSISFSELLTYYESDPSEQFVELYNNSSAPVSLDGCLIVYKNKSHALSGEIAANGYFVYYPDAEGFILTKKPSKENTLTLQDADGSIVDQVTYSSSQKKSTSLAQFDYDLNGAENWQITYAPTPGALNRYQEFRTCPEGRIINKNTGNCVKIVATTAKTCQSGYFLNPLTNRCKKYKATTTSVKTCKEGYYLNTSTNRCRKIVQNNGADYSLETSNDDYDQNENFVAAWAIAGIIALLLGYLIFQYRQELGARIQRVFARFREKLPRVTGRRSPPPRD